MDKQRFLAEKSIEKYIQRHNDVCRTGYFQGNTNRFLDDRLCVAVADERAKEMTSGQTMNGLMLGEGIYTLA